MREYAGYPGIHSKSHLVQEYKTSLTTVLPLYSISRIFLSDGYDLGTRNPGLKPSFALAPQEPKKAHIDIDIDSFS